MTTLCIKMTPELQKLIDVLQRLASNEDWRLMGETQTWITECYKPDKLKASGEIIDFRIYLYQLCYIIRYGLNNVLSVFSALQLCLEDSIEYAEWLSEKTNERLKVCSIGGGAGTDGMAMNAYLNWLADFIGCEQATIGECTVLDRYTEWKNMYDTLNDSAKTNMPPTTYLKFDFEDAFSESCDWVRPLKKAHIVTMIKFVSSVNKLDCRTPQDVSRKIGKLLRFVQPGGLFVFMDSAVGVLGKITTEAAKENNFRMCYSNYFEVSTPVIKIGGYSALSKPKIQIQLWLT